MKILSLAVVIILSLILQTRMSLFGISPSLMVVVAYYLGIKNSSTQGILAGSLVGLIEDSVVGGMIGPNILGKGMAGFFSSFISGGIFRWTPLLGMLAISALTMMDGLVVFLSRVLYETIPAPPSRVILSIVVQGLMNSALGIVIRPKNAE